jgi:uncharacterized membrane protein YfcA
MNFFAHANDLALIAAAIVIGGVVTGLLAGMFGIGGGGVIVPVLYEVFRALEVPESVRMQLCVGTSLAIIVPTAMRSYRAHRERGAVMSNVVRIWTIPAVAGVGVGALIAGFAPGWVFKLAFCMIAATIAFKLLLGRDDWRIADDLPRGLPMIVYGFLIGLSASLMGVSGGSVSNAILTLHNRPIHSAVATSAGLGIPITIAGAIGFAIAGLPQQALMPPLSIGFVSLIGFALMAPVSTFVARYGARLAHALPRRKLEIAFGIFLLVISVRFLAGLLL